MDKKHIKTKDWIKLVSDIAPPKLYCSSLFIIGSQGKRVKGLNLYFIENDCRYLHSNNNGKPKFYKSGIQIKEWLSKHDLNMELIDI